jgi:predicted ATPase/signal transduction histidine kinase
MILEDFGATTLGAFLYANSPGMDEILEMAIDLSASIGSIHQQGIVHNNINPMNIFVHPQTRQVKISGFFGAFHVDNGLDKCVASQMTARLPAYISPESTRRINQTIDLRSDLYSLGVVLYRIFTGQLPFQAADSMELIHAHIARKPISPQKRNPILAPTISDIIMKLMAKPAIKRYQNAWSLGDDLKECLRLFNANGRIANFTIGASDRVEKIQIPHTLCGREKELQILKAEGHKAANGETRALFFSGPAGMGKSFLVQKAQKRHRQRPAYCIAGKFDQNNRSIPYSAIIQGLEGLVEQLFTVPPEELERCKNLLSEALGPNGYLITRLVPDLELIIGKQPPHKLQDPMEAQNRFYHAFRHFIGVFAQPEQPLMICLDDWQWADPASLDLFTSLMNDPEGGHLFFVGTYRDTAVTHRHPLMQTIEDLEQDHGLSIRCIPLEPLALNHVEMLIDHALDGAVSSIHSLTEIVHTKSQGNPLVSLQFLQRLYDKRILRFEPIERGWLWDMGAATSMGVSTNVVDLMLKRLVALPPATFGVLQSAACIGNRFDVAILTMARENSARTELLEGIQDAIDQGFILPEDGPSKSSRHRERSAIPDTRIYRFLHDKVQQAAYAMLSNDAKRSVHNRIGHALLHNLPQSKRDEWIYTIVNQLNRGVAAMIPPEEGEKLADLNLQAGKKAKDSAAFEAALVYLTRGIDLLPTNSWQDNYPLALALYTEAAEAAYLYTDFELMQRYAAEVLQRAKNLIDKIRVYEVRIQALNAQNNPLEGVETGLSILRQLGHRLPQNPTRIHLLVSILKTRFTLVGKRIAAMEDLPEIDDPEVLAALRLFCEVGTASYFARPNLMPLTVLKSVALIVRHGNSSQSAFICSAYGVILCGVLGKFEAGYRFGRLSLHLLSRFRTASMEARIITMVSSFINHWKEPIEDTLDSLQKAYRIGLETGDLEWAAMAAHKYCLNSYFCGRGLVRLEKDFQVCNQAIDRVRHAIFYIWNDIYHQSVRNLMGLTEDPCRINLKMYIGDKGPPAADRSKLKNTMFLFHFHKLILEYLFQRYTKAYKDAKIARKHLEGLKHRIITVYFVFYDSLILLAILPGLRKGERRKIARKIDKNRKLLRKWAHQAPMNYLHKHYLVEAERFCVQGRLVEATKYYHQAIQAAHKSGQIHEEALANELAAKFYISRQMQETALSHVKQSHYLYGRWGATAKVADLEKRFPIFSSLKESLPETSNAYHMLSNPDLSAVVKASQAISGEIVLERLLSRLIGISMENAGADRAAILLQREGRMFLEAEGSTTSEEMIHMEPISIENVTQLPQAIILFVMRKCEPVLLDNAPQDVLFSNDAYIRKKQPQSIYCIPVTHQERLTAILYLENSLSTSVFTQKRRQILELLTAQAAISLQNAILYKDIASAKQSIQNLSRKLIQTQESERQKISRDLHDNVAQLISSAKIMGETLFDEHPQVDPRLKNKTHKICNRLQESIAAVRELSYDLRPPGLDRLGLVKSIYRYCDEFSNNLGLKVDFLSVGLENVHLDPTVEINLYRIVQEALNNVKKHAHASNVMVRLLTSFPNLILRIKDDGLGFDTEEKKALAIKEKRMGLISMEERVLLLRGNIQIKSVPKEGTMVVVEIPCMEIQDEKAHSDRG